MSGMLPASVSEGPCVAFDLAAWHAPAPESARSWPPRRMLGGFSSNVATVQHVAGGPVVVQAGNVIAGTGTVIVNGVASGIASGAALQLAQDPAVRAMIAYGVLRAQVAAWAELPEDWDGNDGVAPSSLVVENATVVLNSLEAKGISPPNPVVAGDGEIGFRWDRQGAFASINLLDDGHLVAFIQGPGLSPLRVDEPMKLADISSLMDRLASVA